VQRRPAKRLALRREETSVMIDADWVCRAWLLHYSVLFDVTREVRGNQTRKVGDEREGGGRGG
jgi:hypothetical protein